MQEFSREIILLIVILLANFLQGITGFAGAFLTMSPAIHLVGVEDARIIVAVMAQVSGLMVVATDFRHIVWKECGRMLFWSVIGTFAGLWIFASVDLKILLVLYGILIIVIALKNLITLIRGTPVFLRHEIRADSPWMILLMLAAGILNGTFLSGGALLVVYAAKALPVKEEMRATLAFQWIVLCAFVSVPAAFHGQFTPRVMLLCGIGVLLLLAATWAGTKVMQHISQDTFIRITYMLLLAAGILVLV